MILLIEKLLESKLYQITVAVPYDSHYIIRYQNIGAKVLALRMSRLRRTYNPFYWLTFLILFIKDIFAFRRLIKTHGVEIVHVNMHSSLSPILAGYSCGKKIVLHYRAKTNDDPKWFFDLYLPFLYRCCDAIITISQKTANHFLYRDLKKNIHVVYNPLHPSFFEDPSKLSNPYIQNTDFLNKKIILYVGRIDPQKCIETLIGACQILFQERSDFALCILGSASKTDKTYEEKLRSITCSFPVEWVSAKQDVRPYLYHANTMVLPSINEGFGRVLVEAMALKTPVVGANSGAIAEILQNNNFGQLFEARNAKDLSKQLNTSIDQAKTHPTVLKAFEYTKLFSPTQHECIIVNIYSSL